MQLELFVYSVDLHPPLGRREGLLLRLCREDQRLFAEASPLPGWSVENLEDVIHESKSLLHRNHLTLSDLESALAQCRLASLQFALESLIAQIHQYPPAEQCIPVQGIRFRDESIDEELLLQFSTWKIKIRSLSEWISIAPQFASASRIRLDANRDLKSSDLKLLRFDQNQIEFIEEPGEEFHLKFEKSPSALPSIQFALDESLHHSPSLPPRASHPHCAAFILKPTLHGKAHYKELAFKAIQLQKQVILSSSIESPIGLYQISCLCEEFRPTTSWGLGTYRYFPKDFCFPFPKITKKGFVVFSPITWVNDQYLKKVL